MVFIHQLDTTQRRSRSMGGSVSGDTETAEGYRDGCVGSVRCVLEKGKLVKVKHGLMHIDLYLTQ